MPSQYADLPVTAAPYLWGVGPSICEDPKCAKVIVGSRRRYCSRTCCVRHYQRDIWCPMKRRKLGEVERVCGEVTCGKPFLQPARLRRKREYCQKKCKTKASHRRQKEKLLSANPSVSEVCGTAQVLGEVRRTLLPRVPDLDRDEVLGYGLSLLREETREAVG